MKLNAFQLKWIAIITMLIDHIGAVILRDQSVLRIIGRLSFPIFCFLLVEGFFHTRNVQRYILRLGVFALISEIPYELALYRGILFPAKNVFFTLLIGMILMYALEKNKNIGIQIVELLLAMWGASVLHTDYGSRGVLLIAVFYFFHKKKVVQLALGAGWNFLYGFGAIQNWGAFAMPLLALYNGEQGRRMKYFFYAFYPVHLLILYAIDLYVTGGPAFYIYPGIP